VRRRWKKLQGRKKGEEGMSWKKKEASEGRKNKRREVLVEVMALGKDIYNIEFVCEQNTTAKMRSPPPPLPRKKGDCREQNVRGTLGVALATAV
jgi:hypothetical protein